MKSKSKRDEMIHLINTLGEPASNFKVIYETTMTYEMIKEFTKDPEKFEKREMKKWNKCKK